MKNKNFTVGSCQINDIIIYFIGTKTKFVHLSFARSHHDQALRQLVLSGATIYNSLKQETWPFCQEFEEYIRGCRQVFSVRINPLFLDQATPFQQRVWQLIKLIPYGETRTYGELAKKLGNRHYARAVGQACGANSLALLIPCHRVVGSNNNPGGFNGGEHIKAKLLEIEKNHLSFIKPYQ